MPTSRYESYPKKDELKSKEEITGQDKIEKYLGEITLKDKDIEN